MLEGIAVGGPRAGIKLSAEDNWDGRIKERRQSDNKNPKYYPGRYVWDGETWRWLETGESLKSTGSPRHRR